MIKTRLFVIFCGKKVNNHLSAFLLLPFARERILRYSFVLLLLLFSCFSWAVDPFEDFHQYGELSDEEIHELHKGEVLYGDTEFGFILSKGNTNSPVLSLKGIFIKILKTGEINSK